MSAQPELAPTLSLEAESPLVLVHEDTPLSVMTFPMEVNREKMINDLLQDSCEVCQPKRREKAHEMAFYSGRIGVGRAVLLIEEKLGCTHLDD